MVEQGMAVAYHRYSSLYVRAENTAQNARRSIWAGDFIEPELWRRQAKLTRCS